MRIGVDYYPEHWDRSLWEQDADRMQSLGVRLVRLAEFAWSRIEPEDGVFDFAWLDEAVTLFAERQIGVVLCTPTSCPPRWFYEKYPDAVMTETDGTPTRLGIRGHRCINHEAVRRYSERIIIRMAEHYAGHPALAAWQIDNELEAYFCCCGNCAEKFRRWLQRRYSSLEQLNRSWGTAVWSGEYSSWLQVQPPLGHYASAWMNPAYMLDFSRFCSDNVIEFCSWQADLLRKHCPGIPVTTNVWFSGHMPDFYREFADLDFISYDNYPTTRLPDDPETCYSHAFHLDLMRGVKRAPFWIMEQLSGSPGCWAPMSRMPAPGMIRGYALQAFAHGADTVSFFRWRTANIGAEMHWHGLIDHSNVPGRRLREFAALCEDARGLEPLQGSEIHSDVAILFSFDNEYAFKIQPQTEGYYYFEQLQRLHRAFMALGLNVDILPECADLSGYRIVCAPEMYVTNPEAVASLQAFAEKGGTVLLTTRSGVKDTNNNAVMAPLPAAYRTMAGACVAEYTALAGDTVRIRWLDGETAQGKQWCDILEPEGAAALAYYDSDYFSGKAAVTCNAFGGGQVYYIGCVGEQKLYDRIALRAVTDAGIPNIPDLPPRVEVTTRTGRNGRVRFIFNNADRAQHVRIGGDEWEMQPFEMKIAECPD